VGRRRERRGGVSWSPMVQRPGGGVGGLGLGQSKRDGF